MKNKRLIVTIIVFCIIVNTSYYWKGKHYFLTFPAFFILFIVYVGLGLGLALIRELYFAFKDNFKDKKRILTIGLLITVLTLTFLKPFGFINFEEFEGKNVLIAEREGVAGCMMTLKLKDNNEFTAKAFALVSQKLMVTISSETILSILKTLNLEEEKKNFTNGLL